MITIKT